MNIRVLIMAAVALAAATPASAHHSFAMFDTSKEVELANATVVQRVTVRLNGVRPTRPAGTNGSRPAKSGTIPSSTTGPSTTAASVSA